MSFEGNDVYYSFQGQQIDDNMVDAEEENKYSKEEALIKFVKFIREWKQDNKYIYRWVWVLFANFLTFLFRDQLNDNSSKEMYLLLVDIDDLTNFDQKLASTVRTHPAEYLKIVSVSAILIIV